MMTKTKKMSRADTIVAKHLAYLDWFYDSPEPGERREKKPDREVRGPGRPQGSTKERREEWDEDAEDSTPRIKVRGSIEPDGELTRIVTLQDKRKPRPSAPREIGLGKASRAVRKRRKR